MTLSKSNLFAPTALRRNHVVAVVALTAMPFVAIVLLMSFKLRNFLGFSEANHPAGLLTKSGTGSSGRLCSPKREIPRLLRRESLGALAEQHGLKSGAEVGVQQGKFSKMLLDSWPSCESFRLIDLWAPQENYHDGANVDQIKHDGFLEEALTSLRPHEGKISLMRMLSSEAAKLIKPESLDFVYIDARHDYCGVMEDLDAYWPLISPGGILAGHDYETNKNKLKSSRGNDDWSLCANGTRIESAVKGAVNDFFVPRGLTVSLTRKNRHPTWIVQKPSC